MGGAAPVETALIVPVPAADPVVGRHRRELDHSAVWGVPAHLTISYPFLAPGRITEAVVGELRALLSRVESFGCVFRRVEWFGNEVVWLAPEPAEPFHRLIELVWRRFPECPPYGGAHREVVPHLTVGSTRLGEPDALRRAAVAVGAELPFRAVIDRVRLVAGATAPGSWHPVTEFGLPGSAGRLP
ncbi:2'-5' RNA ligase family protein [Amycolatopsis ultiminotia]